MEIVTINRLNLEAYFIQYYRGYKMFCCQSRLVITKTDNKIIASVDLLDLMDNLKLEIILDEIKE